MDWTRPAPARTERTTLEAWLARIPKIIDWEAAITLVLVLGAVAAVTAPLEGGGWSDNMPPLTTVSVVSVIVAMLLARSRLSMFLAWPVSIVCGALVVFWQTLVVVGPGTLSQRLDAVYYRFDAWFNVVFSDQVTNDSLPFNVLIISATWIGVFLFGWSVYRWHNAWIGLIPGGVALFLDLVLVGDELTGGIVLYMLFGFLLVMQTNLLANMTRWRAEGAQYPPLLNVSFMHFSLWALIALLTFAWIVPAGPFSTPAPVQSVIDRALTYGSDFVRLAGPLHSKKVIPIHSYSGVLPFQGSIRLGDRELLSVTVTDPEIEGPLLLRGSVYDQYEGGGWRVGERREVTFPPSVEEAVKDSVDKLQSDGLVVPLHVELEAKSVVGTVVFVPGQAISTSRQDLAADIPASSVQQIAPDLGGSNGRDLTDEEVLAVVAPDYVGISVVRGEDGTVRYVEAAALSELGVLADAVELDPGERIKRHRSYNITGFVPTVDPEALRALGPNPEYPESVLQTYTQLPEDMPLDRVNGETALALGAGGTPLVPGEASAYDITNAIEDYLRTFPPVYEVEDTPPGRDTVDYFLETKQGYFDYHASTMVVMLRNLRIPARLAVGFVATEEDVDSETGAYIVRDRDSFSWPEVYFPGHGWVTFNPSSDAPEDLAPQISDDPVQLNPEDGSILDQLPIGGGSFNPTDGSDLPDFDRIGDSGGSILDAPSGSGYTPWATIAVVLFAGMIFISVFTGWQRSVAGLPYPQQLWEKTVRLASWGGIPPSPGQTPHDYAARLGKRFRQEDEMRSLADAYTRSRFGHKETDAEVAESLRASWPDIREALVGGVVGRVFRRRRRRED